MRFPSTLVLLVAVFNAAAQTDLTHIDSDALQSLMDTASTSHSDAMVVYRGEKRVGAWYFGKEPEKIDASLATMSVASLAVGLMLSKGTIPSLEAPVSSWYPQWKEGPKSEIQLRHLLNNTSGLYTDRRADTRTNTADDFIKLALDAKMVHPVGSIFTFNGRAVNLISGIVAKATGKPLDTYLQDELFTPMGITDVEWAHDKTDTPLVMTGLKIFPEDLARLGVLCLQQGTWQGKELIAKSWFAACFAAGSEMMPTSGLLWWRIPSSTTYVIDEQQLEAYAKAGVSPDFVKKMSSLQGRYSRRSAFFAVLKGGLGENWRATANDNLSGKGIRLARREYGDFFGYNANGTFGQYLVIFPEKNLVGVRMIAKSSVQDTARDSFNNFADLLRHLVP